LGRVNTSRQELIVAAEVLVMVRFSVSPLFQALTTAATRQDPGGGVVAAGVVSSGVVTAGVVVTGGVVGVVAVLSNWEMNLHTSAEVQVREPLAPVDPSTGFGMWSPSKAAHW